MSVVTLTGQLLNTRPLSSRLAFADLRLVSSSTNHSSDSIASQDAESSTKKIMSGNMDGEVVELVFKACHGSDSASPAADPGDEDNSFAAGGPATLEHMYVSSVPLALKAVCVGDVVLVRGMWEAAARNGRADHSPSPSGNIPTLRCCEAPVVLNSWASAGNEVPFVPVYVSKAAAAATEVVTVKDDDAASKDSVSVSGVSILPSTQGVAEGNNGTNDNSPSAKELTSTADSGICKFFVNTGRCPKGGDGVCRFSHPSDPKVRAAWVAARRKEKREKQALLGDSHQDPHAKQAKGARADVFAAWLVATFGMDYLASGSGVLDIAGGRGELSFELGAARGVPCTTIDPRERKLSKKEFKWHAAKRKAKAKALKLHASDINGGTEGTGGEKGEEHIQEDDTGKASGQHIRACFEHTFADSYPALLRDCTCIVGMHPDQATEDIVDVAISHQKPFAIVPCCVFPKDGSSMPFEAWVDYLRGKASNIQTAYLNFQGRNLVLYATGYDGDDAHDNETSLGTMEHPKRTPVAPAQVAGDLRPKKEVSSDSKKRKEIENSTADGN